MKLLKYVPCLRLLAAVTLCASAGCAALPSRKVETAAAQQEVKVQDDFAMEYAKGRNLESSGDLEKARTTYTQLRQRHPKNANVLHRLAVVSDLQRRHKEAQKLYTEAIRQRPNDAELFNDLGYCFYLQGKLGKAESAMRKAVQLNPESRRFHINLGMAIGHQGRLKEAFAEFSKAGSAADAYYNLASVHSFRGDFEESKVCFGKALAVDPNHRLARQSLDNFVKYESTTVHDEATLVADKTLVPHVEGAPATTVGDKPSGSGQVMQVSHSQELPTPARATNTTRSLHRHARGMLKRNMASQRQPAKSE